MMQNVYIYGLKDPNTDEIRYIGKSNDIEKRLKSHVRDMYRRNYPVYFWMRNLAKEKLMPLPICIKITDSNNWQKDEKETINKFISNGFRLLNLAARGDEPYCSVEQRRKNGKIVVQKIQLNLFKKRVWELKKKMGISLFCLKKNNKIEAYNRIVRKLKIAANKNPKLFGDYLMLKEIA